MTRLHYIACGIALSLLAGCSKDDATSQNLNKVSIPAAEQTIYQRAVNHNALRPKDDFDADMRRKPADILAFAGVKRGDILADLLGGGGWYTELLSAVVGSEGKVYLVNSPLFINFTKDKIEARLKGGRLENVTRVDGPWTDLGMQKNSLDFIWLSLAYHDIYVPRPENPEFEADPELFFKQMFDALKPGGKILVIDHADAKGTGNANAASLHRIEEAFAKVDFARHGFTLLKTSDVLRNPKDDYTKDIWKKSVINKTDKFIHLYQKPIGNSDLP